MPNAMAKLLMLVMGGIFIGWYWHAAKRKSLEIPEAEETVKSAASVGTIMALCLASNGLAFIQPEYIEWVMEAQTGVWDTDGNYLGPRVNRFHLLIDQINLFIGTGYMMWIILDAITLKHFSHKEISEIKGWDVLQNMLKRMALNYWWIIISAFVLFGATSGIGMIFFLAVELSIMWGIVWIGPLLMNKKVKT